MSAPATRDWLELALDYRCNLRCLGCRACEGTSGGMTTAAAVGFLRRGRAQRIPGLWLGGGEPTLRDDLLPLVRAARALGYERVLLQTNGLRLAYPAYARALVDAGVTALRLNLKSHDPALHDRLTESGGSHALLEQALEALAGLGPSLAGDLLLTRSTAPGLAPTLSHYAARGVTSFALWLLSAHDAAAGEAGARVLGEVPKIGEITGHLRSAQGAARANGVTLRSFHTPPCALPEELRDLFEPAAALRLVVVDAGGASFRLEDSPFEGGARVAACAACSARESCAGPRADYLALHGEGEFRALP